MKKLVGALLLSMALPLAAMAAEGAPADTTPKTEAAKPAAKATKGKKKAPKPAQPRTKAAPRPGAH